MRKSTAFITMALALMLLCGAALAQETAPLSPTTGLAATGAYRPVIVEIDNDVDARPHLNMSEADIVYECIFWGPGYTRYTLVFNDSHPDYVGSVRSSRMYVCVLRQEWDAPFVFWGGQTSKGPCNIIDYFTEHGVTEDFLFSANRLYNETQMMQVTRPVGVHFRMGDRPRTGANGVAIVRNGARDAAANIKLVAEQYWPQNEDGTSYEPRGHAYLFSDTPTRGDGTAVAIDIQYDNKGVYAPSYTFSPEDRVYERWYRGREQFDGMTGKRIAASNVIVQYVNISYSENIASRPMVGLIGAGPIDAFIDGRHIRGTWTREGDNSRTIFADESGEELTLLPGKTFIQILPMEHTFTYTDADGNEHAAGANRITK